MDRMGQNTIGMTSVPSHQESPCSALKHLMSQAFTVCISLNTLVFQTQQNGPLGSAFVS